MFTAPSSNVAIICESEDAGQHAKRFSAQLTAHHPTPCNLNQSLWKFRGLGKREIRNLAASTAASADVVIFSMSGLKPLPAQVQNWIEMWIWLIDGRKPALVALFATQNPESVRVQAYLRRGAVSKGLAFFPHTSCVVTDLDHDTGISAKAQNKINGVTAAPIQFPQAAAI